jgi:hypothetical protein
MAAPVPVAPNEEIAAPVPTSAPPVAAPPVAAAVPLIKRSPGLPGLGGFIPIYLPSFFEKECFNVSFQNRSASTFYPQSRMWQVVLILPVSQFKPHLIYDIIHTK